MTEEQIQALRQLTRVIDEYVSWTRHNQNLLMLDAPLNSITKRLAMYQLKMEQLCFPMSALDSQILHVKERPHTLDKTPHEVV